MNLISNKFLTAALAVASLLSVGSATLSAQATTPAPAPAKAAKAAPKPAPTAAEIADATSKGMVWVNLNTKVYHKAGTDFYGKTKNGQFMTEADATKAGYKAAQEPKMKAPKAPKATATTAATPK